MRSFATCTLHPPLLGSASQGGWDGACSTHGRDEQCIQNS